MKRFKPTLLFPLAMMGIPVALSSPSPLEAELASDRAYWDSVAQSAKVDPQEPTPAEIAAEEGLDPFALPSEEFATQAPAPGLPFISVDVFVQPMGVGIRKEFIVVSMDGRPQFAAATSTAAPGSPQVYGSWPLSYYLNTAKNSQVFGHPTRVDGPRSMREPGTYKGRVAWPWKRSQKYSNSTMYWGLHVVGGVWMHSTPHYSQLGGPASKGCVRLTYPTAMEVFDLVTNRAQGNARISIHRPEKARAALAGLGLDSGWVNDQIARDLSDARAAMRPDGEYLGNGHARQKSKLAYPSCQGHDCFSFFGMKPRVQ